MENQEEIVKKILYLVGDKFDNFAENDNTMTVAQLMRDINDGNFQKKVLCIFGQGVNEEESDALQNLVYQHGLQASITFGNLDILSYKENKDKVHKHHKKNATISKPVPRGHNSYESILLVDNASAEISDHITGQHMSGMVLLEAARQMMLAVIENVLAPKDAEEKYYVILNGMNIDFAHFAFPLELRIYCNIKDYHEESDRITSTMEFAFIVLVASENYAL